MYVDDFVIYCQANEAEAKEVKHCLETYCQWTRQMINWDKSVVHFSRNTTGNMKANVCEILGMKECNHTGSYLGNPFCNFSSRYAAFQFLMDKLSRKLAGWKEKTLSLAGRSTLVKTVAMAVPSYVMQTFLLSKKMCDKMDGIVRRFFWGYNDAKRHLCLKAWDNICAPKASGGLGI